MTGSWARLSDPSVPHPIALFSQAAVQIEVLDMTATILANHGFTEALIARAQHGCRVRILIGAPQRQLEPLIGNTDLELRTANANIGVPAVIRADDTILLPIPLTGEDWPALIQLQRQIDGGIFDRIASHFQTLWDTAKPITNPGQLNDTPGRPQPDPQSPPQTAPRRWPRQPD